MGSLYKLLPKVLTNRLKKVISNVVSPTQYAFVDGRHILDASLIDNEVINSTLKNKDKGVLCKLDIEKAYDHLNWDFLFSIMDRMGFGKKWFDWIRWCVTSASFLVLVNKSPVRFFQSSWGLRQGDSLSPYLFVLRMGTLSKLIDGVFLSGYRFKSRRGHEVCVSHLLFVDDTLIFCKDSGEEMAYLSWTLMWFEAASGLRINLDKSSILPMGRVENVESLVREVGCTVGELPTTYMEIPFSANHKLESVWDGVKERYRKRLALWKLQYISKGGRLTLIRSTLSNMPIYFLSLLRIPRKVKLRLEKIQRNFLLWGGSA